MWAKRRQEPAWCDSSSFGLRARGITISAPDTMFPSDITTLAERGAPFESMEMGAMHAICAGDGHLIKILARACCLCKST